MDVLKKVWMLISVLTWFVVW